MLPFFGAGVFFLVEIFKDKLAASQGRIRVEQMTKSGRIKMQGYGFVSDGNLLKVGKKTAIKNYSYDRKLTIINRWGCPVALYGIKDQQIDPETGEGSSLKMSELGNLIGQAYELGVMSNSHSSKFTELQKWLPIIIGGATMGMVWYYCNGNPEMFELLKLIATTK